MKGGHCARQLVTTQPEASKARHQQQARGNCSCQVIMIEIKAGKIRHHCQARGDGPFQAFKLLKLRPSLSRLVIKAKLEGIVPVRPLVPRLISIIMAGLEPLQVTPPQEHGTFLLLL
jgi:hypothetical protein